MTRHQRLDLALSKEITNFACQPSIKLDSDKTRDDMVDLMLEACKLIAALRHVKKEVRTCLYHH